MSGGAVPWPVELRVDAARVTLTIAFDSGETFALPAEYLRVESPSAEVQGHSAAQKQIVPGKRQVPRRGDVRPDQVCRVRLPLRCHAAWPAVLNAIAC